MSLFFTLTTPKRCHKRQPGIREPNARIEKTELYLRCLGHGHRVPQSILSRFGQKMSRLLAGSGSPQFGVQISGSEKMSRNSDSRPGLRADLGALWSTKP